MSLREGLVFLHILGALLLAAGVGTSMALGIAGGRTDRTRLLGMASGLRVSAARFMILPGAVIAIVFGSWLVSEADYDFGGAWLSASYVLWLVTLGLSTGMLTPHARRVRDEAARLAADGVEASDALRAQFASSRPRVADLLLLIVVVAFLYLMVAKPGA